MDTIKIKGTRGNKEVVRELTIRRESPLGGWTVSWGTGKGMKIGRFTGTRLLTFTGTTLITVMTDCSITE